MQSGVQFLPNFLDPTTPVTLIGGGQVGGKAKSLIAIREALNTQLNKSKYPDITIAIPSLVILGTNVFDSFMTQNNLAQIASSDLSDEHIATTFQQANLPFEILGDLRRLVEQVDSPLAVRSSSLLEDTLTHPFAGVYTTKMIPNNSFDPDTRFRQLVDAIKFVYASTYSKSAKEYRKAIGLIDQDEKMAVVIQKLVGKRFETRFYPELSGVARSYNYYPMDPVKPEDGVVSLALGLGKTIVDGGMCWTYSPRYPQNPPPFGSIDELMHNTQTEFWAVNIGEPPEYNPIIETEYMQLEKITTADRDGTLRHLASTYSPITGRLAIGTGFDGPRALTFAPILNLDEIPLNDLILDLLAICEKQLGTAVEIEFAMTFNPNYLGFLQARSMLSASEELNIELDEMRGENVLVACDHALGFGEVNNIQDIVYTKPSLFNLNQTRGILPELEQLNAHLLDNKKSYLLIVLGRLGTTDPWLGIPIPWGKINGARVVVETTHQKIRVELSQGSHYFHNITSLGIKYFTLSITSPYLVDWEWLDQQPANIETQFLRHISLEHPLRIRVDGRTGRGVIYKR